MGATEELATDSNQPFISLSHPRALCAVRAFPSHTPNASIDADLALRLALFKQSSRGRLQSLQAPIEGA